MSLTSWRYDSIANPIDIGFIKNDGPNHPVAKTFPASQCNAQLGNVDDSFRVFAGGRFKL